MQLDWFLDCWPYWLINASYCAEYDYAELLYQRSIVFGTKIRWDSHQVPILFMAHFKVFFNFSCSACVNFVTYVSSLLCNQQKNQVFLLRNENCVFKDPCLELSWLWHCICPDYEVCLQSTDLLFLFVTQSFVGRACVRGQVNPARCAPFCAPSDCLSAPCPLAFLAVTRSIHVNASKESTTSNNCQCNLQPPSPPRPTPSARSSCAAPVEKAIPSAVHATLVGDHDI